jgi:hypothetical protein
VKSFLQYITEHSDPDNTVLFHDNKIIVGVGHGSPFTSDDTELVDKIKQHGQKHGFYYEGKPGSDISQPQLGLQSVKDYAGGFDEMRDQTIQTPQDLKPHHLSILFGNVDTNWKQGVGSHFQSGTVFDGIHSWARSHWGDLVTPDHVSRMLTAASKNTGKNFLELAKTTPATQGKRFLSRLETIAWPDNWATKKRTTGPEQLVDQETASRDSHLLGMGPGVYVIGSGHLDSIQKQVN